MLNLEGILFSFLLYFQMDMCIAFIAGYSVFYWEHMCCLAYCHVLSALELRLLWSWYISHFVQKLLAFLNIKICHMTLLIALWTFLVTFQFYLRVEMQKQLFYTSFPLMWILWMCTFPLWLIFKLNLDQFWFNSVSRFQCLLFLNVYKCFQCFSFES